MILFDTSVLIDARDAGNPWHQWAKRQIVEAHSTEGAAVNTVIIAEGAVHAEDREHFPSHLEKMGLTLLPLPISAAAPAAKAFALYLQRLKAEGIARPSKMPLGDFLASSAESVGKFFRLREPS